jgi:hypothetical protein
VRLTASRALDHPCRRHACTERTRAVDDASPLWAYTGGYWVDTGASAGPSTAHTTTQPVRSHALLLYLQRLLTHPLAGCECRHHLQWDGRSPLWFSRLRSCLSPPGGTLPVFPDMRIGQLFGHPGRYHHQYRQPAAAGRPAGPAVHPDESSTWHAPRRDQRHKHGDPVHRLPRCRQHHIDPRRWGCYVRIVAPSQRALS